MNKIIQIIKKVLLTSKGKQNNKIGKYIFLCKKNINKCNIVQTMKKYFNIKILKVNTMNVKYKCNNKSYKYNKKIIITTKKQNIKKN